MPFRNRTKGDLEAWSALVVYNKRTDRYVDCYSMDAKLYRASNPVHCQVRVTPLALRREHVTWPARHRPAALPRSKHVSQDIMIAVTDFIE
jgi:hypothetical protein